MKKILVAGGNGFIGHHLCRRLKDMRHHVTSVDIEHCPYGNEHADEIIIEDLRSPNVVTDLVRDKDEIFQMAADMGGCLYVFTGEHDANIMHNSAIINLNFCHALAVHNPHAKIFYSSSACMYPQELQKHIPSDRVEYETHTDTDFTCSLAESDAYPGNPDSEYGWEKLFSERLYLAFARNHGINVRIGRYHNIFGPEGAYKKDAFGADRSKAPARICRKVAEAFNEVEVWGAGDQIRSFLYIDDCINATLALMESDFNQPLNIGSDKSVSILELWKMAIDISGKDLQIKHVEMPDKAMGVRGRNSDNNLIREKLGWEPKYNLYDGMVKTYAWVSEQVQKAHL